MTDLFRKQALAKYLRVDAPGAILSIAPPRTRVIFALMAALSAGLALLAVFARVEIAAEGRGVVRPDEPPVVMRAPFTGTLLSVAAGAHAHGRAGDPLFALDVHADAAARARCVPEVAADKAELSALEQRLADWNDAKAKEHDAATALVLLSQIRTQREKTRADAQQCDALGRIASDSAVRFPVDARVEDIAVGPGSRVREGDEIAELAPASARLVGYVVLDERYRREVTSGMLVRLKFDALPSDELGAGRGHVTRVLEALPAGTTIDAASAGRGFVAEIALDDMPARSGAARSGMTFTADVLTGRRSVLSLLFGTEP